MLRWCGNFDTAIKTKTLKFLKKMQKTSNTLRKVIYNAIFNYNLECYLTNNMYRCSKIAYGHTFYMKAYTI
jgi:hypothetical protein